MRSRMESTVMDQVDAVDLVDVVHKVDTGGGSWNFMLFSMVTCG